MGGGPVGASLVRALKGHSIAFIAPPPQAAKHAGFDPRVYALSPGNVDFLRTLGAWQSIPAERIARVEAMHIFGDDKRAVLEFDAYEAGVRELAWIVEDSELQRALWSGLSGMAFRCEKLDTGADHTLISFTDGAPLAAKLVVGADGAHSFVRQAAGIEARERGLGQTAVVANFHCARAHRNIAYQWFQGGPVLALLPLPGEQVSMVWSLPEAEARRVGVLPNAALAAEVTTASAGILGTLETASAARSFPLQRLSARRLIGPRVALVGDAAHVVHPLAGQGLNLGLQDARALAGVIADREPGRDPGELRLLRRYERRRAEPILAMDGVISGLFALYGADNSFIERLRNAGLNLTNRSAVIKNLLMRQATI
ncbi:MAG TPA: FAD-dependent monooxygenase [Burkholderiales bacterium]|nr:FAD-dependent monooxygenase [Burkholderiales bacterium]